MPIPYIQECADAMANVSAAKADIIEAIDKIKGLANDETWSGTPADTWMTDLNGHVADAIASLGGPLDTAMAECRKHAATMQAKSANPTPAPTPTP